MTYERLPSEQEVQNLKEPADELEEAFQQFSVPITAPNHTLNAASVSVILLCYLLRPGRRYPTRLFGVLIRNQPDHAHMQPHSRLPGCDQLLQQGVR